MTDWSPQTPTATSWTSTEDIVEQYVFGSPYGLLLTLTRPTTETIFASSPFIQVTQNPASWTIQEAN